MTRTGRRPVPPRADNPDRARHPPSRTAHARPATTRGWQHSLDRMGGLCNSDTLVIPGHGELTDPSGLKAMYAYLEQMRAFVKEQIAGGKGRDDIGVMKPEAFKSRGFERMLPVVMNVFYDELTEDEGR